LFFLSSHGGKIHHDAAMTEVPESHTVCHIWYSYINVFPQWWNSNRSSNLLHPLADIVG
jgi:hypothetical protein